MALVLCSCFALTVIGCCLVVWYFGFIALVNVCLNRLPGCDVVWIVLVGVCWFVCLCFGLVASALLGWFLVELVWCFGVALLVVSC